MIYDNKYIPIAIRPNAKLGKLTVSLTGKYYAYDAGLDGFNLVEVKPQQLTVTERDFLCGNLLKETIVADETVTKFVTPLTNTFPNLRFVVITYVGGVAEGLDTSFAGLSVTFVVPNSLLSDYQSAYPSLTFTSWNFQQEFTIPYIGDSELTIEYVSLVCSGASGDIQTVDKVIIPPEFTSFETGVFDYIFLRFSNAQEIEYGGLPSAYQAVEYIESTGPQWVDSGVILPNDFKIQAKIQPIGDISISSYFGDISNGIGAYESRLFVNGTEIQNMWTSDTLYEITINKSQIIRNGVATSINYTGGATHEFPLFKTTDNGNNWAWSLTGDKKIYYFRIYNGTILLRDFIPCYRKSDGEIGMYDKINGVFYTNSGTGVFLKGNDVSSAETISRPALSTCTILYDENTSHTLTPEIVQATLTQVPEFASCEKVIVPEWFTEYEAGALDEIFDAFANMTTIESPWLNGDNQNGGIIFSIDGMGNVSNDYISNALSKLGDVAKSNIYGFKFSAFFTWSSFKHVVWENKDTLFSEFALFDDVIYYGNANMKTVFSTYEVYDYARADDPRRSRAFTLTSSASSTCELCFEVTLPQSTYDAAGQQGILGGRYPLKRMIGSGNSVYFDFNNGSNLGNANVTGINYLRFSPDKQYNGDAEYQYTAPSSSVISTAGINRALMWIRYMLLSDGGTLLRQLIPVRDNGQGKLLDLVSGEFFFGATPFDLGND